MPSVRRLQGVCVTVRDDVLTTAALIADDPSADEHTLVERLVSRGYDILQAELLVVFVPLGLARAVIARLPADPPLKLPDTARIRDFARNRMLRVRLADVPEFVTAQQIGEEAFHTGVIPREQFRAASSISVELNCVSKALNEGLSIAGISGGVMSPPVMGALKGNSF